MASHEDHVSFILTEFLQQVAHRRPIRFIDRKEGLRIKTLLVDLSHRRIEEEKPFAQEASAVLPFKSEIFLMGLSFLTHKD